MTTLQAIQSANDLLRPLANLGFLSQAGVEHLTECPGDLMFNAMVEQCDLPENTKCEPAPTCSCDNCRYPSSEMCSAYWQCEGGQAVQHFCSSGLLFNRDTSQCDLAINVDCSEGAWEEGAFLETACVDRRLDCPKFVKDGGCQCSGSNCDWQSFVLRNCPKSCGNCKENQIISKRTFALEEKGPRRKHGSKESGSKESGSKESGSKESGSKESGSKESGSKESGSKESGSKESHKPGHSHESGSHSHECGGNGGSGNGGGGGDGGNGGGDGDGGNGGGGGDGGNGGGGGDGGNGGNVEASTAAFIDCSLGKYLPHPSDCRKFIQCAPYGPEEMPCAPGTVWNQQKLHCDHEWASPCVTGSYLTPEGLPCGGGSGGNGGGGGDGGNGGGDGGNGGGGGDGGNGGGGGDGGNGGGGGDGGNGGNGGSIDGCVIDCSLGKYLPHPSDCRNFIQCAPYGPEEMPCAPGTVWNQQKLTCDHDGFSVCDRQLLDSRRSAMWRR
ncbi:spidroin-1-like [Penaeus monodon]|uniref:spidroin-1-like n=1 Tax=Penaeus monodon TaxID=6687 RepID=UPI0018A76A3A|nr:spidroin-1-like [Penaeus monodon]